MKQRTNEQQQLEDFVCHLADRIYINISMTEVSEFDNTDYHCYHVT